MVWTICIIAVALASGLQSASSADVEAINTLPAIIDSEIPIQTLPAFFEPEIEAIEMPVAPVINPCDACFEYMTELIEQLTGNDTPVVDRPVPESIAPEVPDRPVPESIEPEMPELSNPVPESIEIAPEFNIVPHPMPSFEAVQGVPNEFLRV